MCVIIIEEEGRWLIAIQNHAWCVCYKPGELFSKGVYYRISMLGVPIVNHWGKIRKSQQKIHSVAEAVKKNQWFWSRLYLLGFLSPLLSSFEQFTVLSALLLPHK